jgi:hypothetical protein
MQPQNRALVLDAAATRARSAEIRARSQALRAAHVGDLVSAKRMEARIESEHHRALQRNMRRVRAEAGAA